jgi:hypothetical protein
LPEEAKLVDYTGYKGYLTKPANGSNVGTWDIPTNLNFDEIDAAIAGHTHVNLSAGNVTLTTDQARSAVLVFEGTPATNVVVTLPASGIGSWICANNISSAVTVTIRSAGATWVTMPTTSINTTTFIWSDGTNVYLADSGSYLSKAGGTLTGGLTLPTNGLSVGGSQLVCTNGNVTLSGSLTAAGDITALSDRRIKSNIRPIEDALNLISRLEGVRYANALGEQRVGVIAQEVNEVIPEVVIQNADGLYSVAYGNIVGVLIEAVKELSARVDELEALNQ